MDFDHRLFASVFSTIVGGEVYETATGTWVVHLNGDLYSQEGVLDPPPVTVCTVGEGFVQKEGWKAHLEATRQKIGNNGNQEDLLRVAEELYEEATFLALDLYEIQEQEKYDDVLAEIVRRHKLGVVSYKERNCYASSVNKTKKRASIFVFPEYEWTDYNLEVEDLSNKGIIPPILASGQILHRGRTTFHYYLIEQKTSLIDFSRIKVNKLSPKLREKAVASLDRFHDLIKGSGYDIFSPSNHQFLYDKKENTFFLKSPGNLSRSGELRRLSDQLFSSD